ncbi:MAG: hypothetical protein K0Q76_2431 [Panacagrimonas sp.]|jgi:hypothetical protein|nr:hypothetical protein [Panacagrimonas sp.]MCC2657323.1 hypothetical protein [Panacagrimonas sp.]
MKSSVLQRLFAGLAGAVLALPAVAQPPAPQRLPNPDKPGEERPAVSIGPREDLRDDAGTTIVGERESPIGLYITPWRNAYAEQDIDRPARLLRVDTSPLDRDVFTRQVEYYEALSDAAAAKRGAAPPAVGAPAPAKP